jgi:ABC-type dipeptide/oligopeptide/nickel transport system permease subunit
MRPPSRFTSVKVQGALTILGFDLLGNGLCDALDPRLRGAG